MANQAGGITSVLEFGGRWGAVFANSERWSFLGNIVSNKVEAVAQAQKYAEEKQILYKENGIEWSIWPVYTIAQTQESTAWRILLVFQNKFELGPAINPIGRGEVAIAKNVAEDLAKAFSGYGHLPYVECDW